MSQHHSVETLKKVGDLLKGALPSGVGFALFIAVSAEVAYLSNAKRDDVVKVLDEWLSEVKGRTFDAAMLDVATEFHRNETPEEERQRLALEKACTELGKVMVGENEAKIALFLFNFGPNGNIAFYMNEDMRPRVKNWIAKHRGLS